MNAHELLQLIVSSNDGLPAPLLLRLAELLARAPDETLEVLNGLRLFDQLKCIRTIATADPLAATIPLALLDNQIKRIKHQAVVDAILAAHAESRRQLADAVTRARDAIVQLETVSLQREALLVSGLNVAHQLESLRARSAELRRLLAERGSDALDADNLTTSVADLESRLTRLTESELPGRRERVEQLTREVEKATAERDARDTSIAELERGLAALAELRVTHEARRTERQRDIDARQTELSALTREIAECEAMSAAFPDDRQRLQEKLQELQKNGRERERELAALTREVDSREMELHKTVEAIERYGYRITSLDPNGPPGEATSVRDEWLDLLIRGKLRKKLTDYLNELRTARSRVAEREDSGGRTK